MKHSDHSMLCHYTVFKHPLYVYTNIFKHAVRRQFSSVELE